MKEIKSELEEVEDIIEIINRTTKYKAKRTSVLFAYCFVSGYTITIKENFFQYIRLVYHNGELIFYHNKKLRELSIDEKRMIHNLEIILEKEIILIDIRQAQMYS